MDTTFVDPPDASASHIRGAPHVVLLHGFPDTYRTWHSLSLTLQQNNFNAHTPMLPGYDPQSRPGSLTLEDIAAALHRYLHERNITSCHLIGHDWGSVIVQSFTLAYSSYNIMSLTLLAIPFNFMHNALSNPKQITLSRYMIRMQNSNAQHRLLNEDWLESLVDTWSDWSSSRQARDDLVDNVRATFEAGNCVDHAVQYYRTNVALDSILVKTALGVLGLLIDSYAWPLLSYFIACLPSAILASLISHHPAASRLSDVASLPSRAIMMVGGRDDGCCDVGQFEAMRGFGARVEIVEQAGHWMHLEREAEVAALILDHIQRKMKMKKQC